MDKLGEGSIVESVDGELFTVDSRGDWWKLSIKLGSSPVKDLSRIERGKVLRMVEKGPLDDFVKGDVISFKVSGRTGVATKHRDDFWQIVGAVFEFTSKEIIDMADEGSIRKVGSICGEG